MGKPGSGRCTRQTSNFELLTTMETKSLDRIPTPAVVSALRSRIEVAGESETLTVAPGLMRGSSYE